MWVHECNPLDGLLLAAFAVLAAYVAYTAYKLLSRLLFWAAHIMVAQAIALCLYKAGALAWGTGLCRALDYAAGGTLSGWANTSVVVHALREALSLDRVGAADDAFWSGALHAIADAGATVAQLLAFDA